MGDFNSKIKQVLLLAIILFLLFMIIEELVIFIPGLLGAVTLYILSRSNYFQLVYNRKWKKGGAAILFIIFDLEIAFLFPWAVVIKKIGWPGFYAMGIFIAILLVGFWYEWKKGALEWE